jgi:hypothetical protein
MTILAGLSPAGALYVRAGEPKVLNVSLALADGITPQNLLGRTFALIVRRSSRIAPLFTINAELSPDGLYVSVMMTAELATAIYEAGYAQSLSYDFVELSGGASTSRFTERVLVQTAPSLPSDIVPIWEMLPYTEAMIRPDALVILRQPTRRPRPPRRRQQGPMQPLRHCNPQPTSSLPIKRRSSTFRSARA